MFMQLQSKLLKNNNDVLDSYCRRKWLYCGVKSNVWRNWSLQKHRMQCLSKKCVSIKKCWLANRAKCVVRTPYFQNVSMSSAGNVCEHVMKLDNVSAPSATPHLVRMITTVFFSQTKSTKLNAVLSLLILLLTLYYFSFGYRNTYKNCSQYL